MGETHKDQKTQIAVFGGGCFWCTEAVFEDLRGVFAVTSGYAGGTSPVGGPNPTYDLVARGKTDYAEVIRIEFDPEQIRYADLLTVFFATHDPTSLNRQGADVGTQYRSIILYTSETQKAEAEKYVADLKKQGVAVVTELKPLEKFYEAEKYHQQYYKNNASQPYCQIVVAPKVEKLEKRFKDLLKSHDKN